MRDAEKLLLDDQLHKTIMQHIETLQHWFRSVITRRKFLRLRAGVIRIQVCITMSAFHVFSSVLLRFLSASKIPDLLQKLSEKVAECRLHIC